MSPLRDNPFPNGWSCDYIDHKRYCSQSSFQKSDSCYGCPTALQCNYGFCNTCWLILNSGSTSSSSTSASSTTFSFGKSLLAEPVDPKTHAFQSKLRRIQLPQGAFDTFFHFLSIHRQPLIREITEYIRGKGNKSEFAKVVSPFNTDFKSKNAKLAEKPSSKHKFEKEKKPVAVQSDKNIEYTRLPIDKNTEFSSIFVAQCIANFEINSLLLAIVYLLRVTVVDRRAQMAPPEIRSSNILASLFEANPLNAGEWVNPLKPFLLASAKPAIVKLNEEAKLSSAEMLQHLPNFDDSVDNDMGIESEEMPSELSEEQELELAQKISLEADHNNNGTGSIESPPPLVLEEAVKESPKLDDSFVHPFCSMALFKSEYFSNFFSKNISYNTIDSENSAELKFLTPKQSVGILLTLITLNCNTSSPLKFLKPSKASAVESGASSYTVDDSKPSNVSVPTNPLKLETNTFSFMLIDFLLDEFFCELQHVVHENSNLDLNNDGSDDRSDCIAENFCFVIWCITSLFKLLEMHFSKKPINMHTVLPTQLKDKIFRKLNQSVGFSVDSDMSSPSNSMYFDGLFDALSRKVFDEKSKNLVQIARHSLKIQAISTISTGCFVMVESAIPRSPLSCANILTPSDKIVPSSSNSPPGDMASNVLDGKAGTKYVNLDTNNNTGFTVLPAAGATCIIGIALTTAIDLPERDPATWKIDGSNDGLHFEPIANGILPPVSTRNHLRNFYFSNVKSFITYKVTFPTVADPSKSSSQGMQIGSVGLLGASIVEPMTTLLRNIFVHIPWRTTDAAETKDLNMSSVPSSNPFPKTFYQFFAINSICTRLVQMLQVFPSPFMKGLYRNLLTGKLKFSSDESIIDKAATTNSSSSAEGFHVPNTMRDLEDCCTINLFLQRLANPDLMSNMVLSKFENESQMIDEFYFGELNLLKNFQSEILQQVLSTNDSNDVRQSTFRTDNKKFFTFTDDRKSVIHSYIEGGKWHTALSDFCMKPNSGVYEVRFFINKCEQGHVFLGLGSNETMNETTSGEYYLGKTSTTWGFIGNKAIWHGNVKKNGNYSTGFVAGHTIIMTYDSKLRTLSFRNESESWGVAVPDLPAKDFYPAVTLYQIGDKITISKISVNNREVSKHDKIDLNYFMAFVSYSQNLIQLCHSLVEKAKSELEKSNEQGWKIILSNPLLTMLMPSLISRIYSSDINEKILAMLSVQLTPYLNKFTTQYMQILRKDSSIVSKFSGPWVFDFMNSASNKCVRKEYDCEVSPFSISNVIPELNIYLKDVYSIKGTVEKSANQLCKAGHKLVKVKSDLTKKWTCECPNCPKPSNNAVHRYRCNQECTNWCGPCFSSEEKVVIESAYYYDKNNVESGNVTEIVTRERRQYQSDGPTGPLLASNRLFEDKLKGKHKTLWINCKNEAGEKTTITFPENSEIVWSRIDELASKHKLSLQGSQFGNRIKFFEELTSGDLIVADGSLSFCGTSFKGEYKIEKKIGDLCAITEKGIIKGSSTDGLNSSFETNKFNDNNQKFAHLCACLLGRFIRVFVSGLPVLGEVKEDSSTNSITNSSANAEMENRSRDKVSSNINKLKMAALFSGGLQNDRHLHQFSLNKMAFFLSPHSINESGEAYAGTRGAALFKSFAELSDKNHKMKDILSGFINQFLSELMPPENLGEESTTTSSSLTSSSCLVAGGGSGGSGGGGGGGATSETGAGSADESAIYEKIFTLLHSQGLMRTNGSKFQYLSQFPAIGIFLECRKKILSALLKHSGYSLLFEHAILSKEANVLVEEVTDSYYWICRRIQNMKDIIISKFPNFPHAECYDIICPPIIERASFLLEIGTCDEGFFISENLKQLQGKFQEVSPKTFANSVISKKIVENFLYSVSRHDIIIKALDAIHSVKKSSELESISIEVANITKIFSAENSLVDDIRTELRVAHFSGLQKLFGLRLLNYYFLENPGFKNKFAFLSAISDHMSCSLLTCDTSFSVPTSDTIALSSVAGSPLTLPVTRGIKDAISVQLDRFLDNNTIMMARSTEQGLYDGQIVALCNWLVRLDPRQHQLLRNVQIFNKIQDILLRIRMGNEALDEKEEFSNILYANGADALSKIQNLESFGGPYLFELMRISSQRLSDIALKIVYGLTAQVAFTPSESPMQASASSSLSLKKQPSGLSTLAKTSLFDLMYTELKICLKNVVIKSFAHIVEKNSSMIIDMDDYTLKMLRLLKLVSTSDACESELTSPKWISLLLSSIGCGSLVVQKFVSSIVIDLLFKLPSAKLSSIVLYVPSLFNERSDFYLEGVNEETYLEISNKYDFISSDSSTENIVFLLLECVSSTIPLHRIENADPEMLFYLSNSGKDAMDFVSAEALIVLRKFLLSSSWRPILLATAKKIFSDIELEDEMSRRRLYRLRIAFYGVFGGYFERLRSGGTISLKPHVLFNQTSSRDRLDARLDVIQYSTFAYLGQVGTGSSGSSSRNNHEVARILRYMNFETSKDDDFTGELYTYVPSAASRILAVDRDDFFPTYDVPALFELLPDDLFRSFLNLFYDKSISWIKSHMLANADSAVDKSKSNVACAWGNSESPRSPLYMRSEDSHHNLNDYDPDFERNDEEADNDEIEEAFEIREAANESNKLNADHISEEETEESIAMAIAMAAAASSNTFLADSLDGNLSGKPEEVGKSANSNSSEEGILEALFAVSGLKSIALGVKDLDLVSELLLNNRRCVNEMLTLSMLETSCGGLDVIESIEEIWTECCDMYRELTKAEREKAEREKAEREKAEREKAEQEKAEREKAEREKAEREIAELEIAELEKAKVESPSTTVVQSSDSSTAAVNPTPPPSPNPSAIANPFLSASIFKTKVSADEAPDFSLHPEAHNPNVAQRSNALKAPKSSSRSSSSSDGSLPELALAIDEEMKAALAKDAALPFALESCHDIGIMVANEMSCVALSLRQCFSEGLIRVGSGKDPASLAQEWIQHAANNFYDGDGYGDNLREEEYERQATRTDGTSSNFLEDVDHPFLKDYLMGKGYSQGLIFECVSIEDNINNPSKILAWLNQKRKEMEEKEEPADEFKEDEEADNSVTVFNPLRVFGSGNVIISDNLTCSLNTVEKQSVKWHTIACQGYPITSGKWYYECALMGNHLMRVGWADLSFNPVGEDKVNLYKGSVGEDAHSWGFDGYSRYLWHGFPVEWGSRWSLGDVIGCAIDMDNRVISFYNKGLGEEVSMGKAFCSVVFTGAMFPCISFTLPPISTKESPSKAPILDPNNGLKKYCKLNFGSTPFKFKPPEGYLPYSNNFSTILAPADPISNPLLRSLYPSDNSLNDKMEITDDLLQNDAKDRYFPVCSVCKNSPSGGDCSRCKPKLPKCHSPERVPTSLNRLIPQLLTISKDLCILYSRLAILRVTHSLPILSEPSSDILLDIFCRRSSTIDPKVLNSTVDLSTHNIESFSSFESLMLLIKISSVFTSRTQLYLNVKAHLSSDQKIPDNHGSIESIGGTSFLDHYSSSMKMIFRKILENPSEDHYFIDFTLDLILSEVLLSSNDNFISTRENLSRHSTWVCTDNNTLCPFIELPKVSNSASFVTPSLHLAVWLTSMLLNEFGYQLKNSSSLPEKISQWTLTLCKNWMLSLKGSSILVKTCSFQIIAGLLHEVTGGEGCKFHSFSFALKKDFINLVPFTRIKDILSNKIRDERENGAIISTYLQHLLELYNVVQYYLDENEEDNSSSSLTNSSSSESATGGGSRVQEVSPGLQNPFLEQNIDIEDPDFDWEAVSGRVVKDDSWVTWTGTISHRKIDNLDGIRVDPKKVLLNSTSEIFPSIPSISNYNRYVTSALEMRQQTSSRL
jgi:hypothetical protein